MSCTRAFGRGYQLSRFNREVVGREGAEPDLLARGVAYLPGRRKRWIAYIWMGLDPPPLVSKPDSKASAILGITPITRIDRLMGANE